MLPHMSAISRYVSDYLKGSPADQIVIANFLLLYLNYSSNTNYDDYTFNVSLY